MAGIVGVRSEDPAERARSIASMASAADHRGNPAESVTVGDVTLGGVNKRTEPPGSEAVAERVGDLGIVWHGSLDNQADLARDLGLRPAATIPETFAAAVGRWGLDGALDRCRGAFAVVATDGRTVWAARDHVGFRPMFYRIERNRAWFGSEAKQVVSGAGRSRRPNLEAIETVYYKGISEDACLEGAKRLMYAEVLESGLDGSVRKRRFWDAADHFETARVGLDEALEQFRALMQQAVRRANQGDAVIALSGGLDSTTIAAFLSRDPGWASRAAFTFVYPDQPAVDESELSRLVADRLGITLLEHVLASRTLDDIEKWVVLADGPWDTLPIPWVREKHQLVAELGHHTILQGDLAEYVFTVNRGLASHLLYRGRLAALQRLLRSRHERGGSWARIASSLIVESLPTWMQTAYYRARHRASYQAPGFVEAGTFGASRYRRGQPGLPWARFGAAQVQAARGTTSTIEVEEIIEELSGVHTRRPFSDIDLWEFFLSLPAEVKFPDAVPKSFLRRAIDGMLPEEIVWRTHKTLFDDHALDRAPYDRLADLIDDSEYRMRGVDYDLLKRRIAERSLSVGELLWADDLAKVHAFMASF